MTGSADARDTGRGGRDEEVLTGIISRLLAEVHPAAAAVPVRLDSRLDTDLGLDNLAVVEGWEAGHLLGSPARLSAAEHHAAAQG